MSDLPLRHLGAPGVQADAISHDLVLTVYARDGRPGETAATIRIPAHDIPNFLTAITNSAMACLQGAASDLARGNCATCGNTRLVKQAKPNGSEWNEHCPDCSSGTRMVAFKDVPSVAPSGFREDR